MDGGARSRFSLVLLAYPMVSKFFVRFSTTEEKKFFTDNEMDAHQDRDAYIYAEGGLGRERGVYSPRLCYTLVERLLRVHQYSSVN